MRNYNELVKNVLQTSKDLQTSSTENQDNLLPLWARWYAGYDPTFHKYSIYNGQEHKNLTKRTLKMAKQVCEDFSALITSEKTDFVIDDKDTLYPLLKSVDIWYKTSRAVEIGFGLSYAGMEVSIDNIKLANDGTTVVKDANTRVVLNYYNAFKTIPITFEYGEVIECAFVSVNTKTTNINLHLRNDDGTYSIVLYRQANENPNSGTFQEIKTNSKTPLFSIIQPNIENNLFLNRPYPISIFANSIDVLKSIDNCYDALDNELMLGRKRIFVSTELAKVELQAETSTGEMKTTFVNSFDANDTVIYALPGGNGLGDDKPLLFSPNDALRVDQIVSALNTNLKTLSRKVGLGGNYYTYEKDTGLMTATQVISEKSETFRNIKKHQLLLEKALQNIVVGLIYVNNEFTLNTPIKMQVPQIVFPDNIVEDVDAMQKRDNQNLANGSMSLVEYRMKYFGEDENVAKAKVYEINGRTDLCNRLTKYMEAFNAGLMTAKMFVNLAYTDEDLKEADITREELIAMLSGSAQTPNNISADQIEALANYDPSLNPNTEE